MPEIINIIYTSLCGGQLVSQIFSSCFGTKINFGLYDQNDVEWKKREVKFDRSPSVQVTASHTIPFEQVSKMTNLVLITCETVREYNLLHRRNYYIETNMRNPYVLDIRLRYQNELKNYLVDKKIDFVDIPFADLFDGAGFIKQIKHCCDKFKLPFDENNVIQAHKKWVYSNARLDKVKHDKKDFDDWKRQNNEQSNMPRNLNKSKWRRT